MNYIYKSISVRWIFWQISNEIYYINKVWIKWIIEKIPLLIKLYIPQLRFAKGFWFTTMYQSWYYTIPIKVFLFFLLHCKGHFNEGPIKFYSCSLKIWMEIYLRRWLEGIQSWNIRSWSPCIISKVLRISFI